MGRAKLDTVVGMASVRRLNSAHLILNLTHSSLLLQQQFLEALEDPKGSVSADRQDAEMQKQSGLSVFSRKMQSQFCSGK